MRISSSRASILFVFAAGLAGCGRAGEIRFIGNDAGDASTDAALADAASADASTDELTSGARCGVNGRNDCGPYALCEPALGCVECSRDSDCPATAKSCVRGVCVGCHPSREAHSPDCPPSAPSCWTSDYACHPKCTGPEDCPAATICDDLSGACIGCRTAADCSIGVCSSVLGRCVECDSDGSCSPRAPRCRLLTNTCVACLSNADCGVTAPICDPLTFTCRRGCTSDEGCPGQRCDAVSATCVDLPPPPPPADAGTDANGDGG